jgi:hypothetical protein
MKDNSTDGVEPFRLRPGPGFSRENLLRRLGKKEIQTHAKHED